MDDFYCLIRLVNGNKIVLFCFERVKCSIYPICFTASNLNYLHKLISMHDYFKNFSISHLLYLAQELNKAELALTFNQIYIQD
uniref:DUF4346 domain-containing protein n=1 Tax=Plocamium cartilagineum TaxID=31452 RepID=A0A1C9CHS1_PLOCA|nr:hypothetical protein Plocam_071 [Plocamium cartilagineum]AOM67907.1 hypothetical protein Plocam_071 [Plocamium cartilagineum]